MKISYSFGIFLNNFWKQKRVWYFFLMQKTFLTFLKKINQFFRGECSISFCFVLSSSFLFSVVSKLFSKILNRSVKKGILWELNGWFFFVIHFLLFLVCFGMFFIMVKIIPKCGWNSKWKRISSYLCRFFFGIWRRENNFWQKNMNG